MKKFFVCAILIVLIHTFLFGETVATPPSNYHTEGAGTQANPFLICSLANLRWLSETLKYWGSGAFNGSKVIPYYFLQTNDIDATETTLWNNGIGFSPIGTVNTTASVNHSTEFFGIYDGSGFKIKNLFINTPPNNSPSHYTGIGFFGATQEATIKNLRLENINYTINHNLASGFSRFVGGLVGDDFLSTFLNCSVTGFITITRETNQASTAIGGLIGSSGSSSIEFCYTRVVIDERLQNGRVGGMIGTFSFGTLKNSFSISSLFDETQKLSTGGLIGLLFNSFIENCYIAGTSDYITINSFIGYIQSSVTVKNCLWDTETSGIVKLYNGVNTETVHTLIDNFGLSTLEMKDANMYISRGWDFDNVWFIDPNINDGYPYLKSMIDTVSEIDKTITFDQNLLLYNYPNPFNPITTIEFTIGKNTPSASSHPSIDGNSHVRIDVYNIRGQHVKTLTNEIYTRGTHSVQWNGTDSIGRSVTSGIYFYRLQSENHNAVKKMILMK
jgi:hypothetical protein